MKKLLWISLSIVLFLFGVSHAQAKTLLKPTAKGNGSVELNLTFEEGYVGAIDLTLKVSDQVILTNVIWNSAISNAYTKRYNYDEANHTIRIYLATGDQTKNLLDKNGNMKIGTLGFRSSNGAKTNYTLDIASLTIVDANYSSIIKNDLEISGGNQFVYEATNTPSGDNKDDNNNNNNDNNNSSNTNNNTSSNNSSSTNNNNATSSNTIKNNTNNINNTNSNDQNSSDTNQENNENNENANENEPVDKEQNNDTETKKPSTDNSEVKKEENKKAEENKKTFLTPTVRIILSAILLLIIIVVISKRIKK